MLNVTLDENNAITILEPEGSLSQQDFENAAVEIDPFIEKHGELKGLLVKTEHFPGWESASALLSHLRFVREHHQHIQRVALVTDSVIKEIGEVLGKHFISASVKTFGFKQYDEALRWLQDQ